MTARYGKFHLEMYIFHSLHFLLWGHQDLIMRSLSHLYFDFLPTSYERAARQGWAGAHWGKMSDPSGRSAPGEINSLLIWQQPHPLQFAEYLYRFNPSSRETLLHEWEEIVTATADFMASYAWWNASSGHYDLGPPMYTVAETTSPNVTRNPTFELAYWRFGLGLASQWKERLGKPVPEQWTHVMENLAPLPLQSGAYALYEGALDTWTNPNITEDHPASLMIYGWLPGPSIPGLNFSQSVFDKTLELTQQTWNFTYSFGWDFPLLAMTSARTGDVDSAIKWLLFDAFQFDDVGMPIGGARVPTPYFPGSGSLLMAIAFLAGGWDGAAHGGPSFPQSWRANVEGFERML